MTSNGSYELHFVRHGDTPYNSNGDRIRGWLDVPLSKEGEAQAVKTANELKDTGIHGMVTSDLSRCQQTANIISQIANIPVLEATHGLRPWHVGWAAGHPSLHVLDALKRQALLAPNEAVPQGESFNSFRDRYLNTVKNIMTKYPDKKIMIVGHHRNNVLMDAWLAAGQKDNNEIDHDSFFQHGIYPGEHKVYHLTRNNG